MNSFEILLSLYGFFFAILNTIIALGICDNNPSANRLGGFIILIMTNLGYYGICNMKSSDNNDLIRFNNTPTLKWEVRKQIFELEKQNNIKISYEKK